MKRTQRKIKIGSRPTNSALTDKPINRDQALTDRVDSEEKTFESNGPEQCRTLRGNKALSRDFIAIQSQPCFGYGPDFSLSARDHDALRASKFQLKSFCEGFWQHAKRSASVHKKLNFFNSSRRTRQLTLYVEQSHISGLRINTDILAQETNNATTMYNLKTGFKTCRAPVERPVKFEFIINLKTANEIDLTMSPPNVLARADRVIR